MLSAQEVDVYAEIAKIILPLLGGGGGALGVKFWFDRSRNGNTPATKGDVRELREDVKGVHTRLDKQLDVCAQRGERIATLEARVEAHVNRRE